MAHGPWCVGPELEKTKIIKYRDEYTIQNHQICKENQHHERKSKLNKSKHPHPKKQSK